MCPFLCRKRHDGRKECNRQQESNADGPLSLQQEFCPCQGKQCRKTFEQDKIAAGKVPHHCQQGIHRCVILAVNVTRPPGIEQVGEDDKKAGNSNHARPGRQQLTKWTGRSHRKAEQTCHCRYRCCGCDQERHHHRNGSIQVVIHGNETAHDRQDQVSPFPLPNPTEGQQCGSCCKEHYRPVWPCHPTVKDEHRRSGRQGGNDQRNSTPPETFCQKWYDNYCTAPGEKGGEAQERLGPAESVQQEPRIDVDRNAVRTQPLLKKNFPERP